MSAIQRLTSANTLSFVDVAIVCESRNEVRVLAEVEESHAPPKKLLGDLVNVVISDRVRIRQKDYCYAATHLFLGVVDERGGQAATKGEGIRALLYDLIGGPIDRFQGIELIYSQDGPELVDRMETRILEAAGFGGEAR